MFPSTTMAPIEIKARVHDFEAMKGRVLKALGTKLTFNTEYNQYDTYYNCTNGVMMLREFTMTMDPKDDVLIWRPSQDTRPSDSVITKIKPAEAISLSKAMFKAYGHLAIVKKRRHVYIAHTIQVSVNLDRVEGLGDFISLTVWVREDQSLEETKAHVADIRQALDIKDEDLVTSTYLDLTRAASENKA